MTPRRTIASTGSIGRAALGAPCHCAGLPARPWVRRAWAVVMLAVLGSAAPERVRAAAIEFEAGSSSISERAPIAYVRVLLDPPANGTERVDFRVTSGTATRDVDYVLGDGTLEFTTGTTVSIVRVQIINDRIPEPPENFRIDLLDPRGAVLGSPAQHTLTILDNDSKPGKPVEPFVQFVGTRGSAVEGTQEGKFGIGLSAEQLQIVRVDYSLEDFGTARPAGVDHSLTTGTAVFQPGQTYRVITFPIIDDELSEPDETIKVRLKNPVGTKIGSNSLFTFTIRDDDTVAVRFADEGSSGSESVALLEVPLELTRTSTERVTVTLEVTGTASSTSDFTLLDPVVTFEPNVTTAKARIKIIDDAIVEDDERLQLTLGRARVDLTTPTTRAYTIIDNDEALVNVGFPTRFGDVDEGTSATTVTVRLSEKQDREVRVKLRVASGSTAGAQDYTLSTTSLTFSSGTLEQSFSVAIKDDVVDEVDEVIVMQLYDPVAARLDRITEYKLWIRDDDEPVEQVDLFRQNLSTADKERVLRLIGPLSPIVNLRGIDIDTAGNIYITDQGQNRAPGEGAVLFMPAGSTRTYRIMEKLTRPGDIELINNQRGFVYATQGGEIVRHGFGISIRVTNTDPLIGKGEAHIFTDLGEKVVKVSPDGLFHVMDLLVDGQTQSTVDVLLRIGGKSKLIEDVPLGQTGTGGAAFGHRIVELTF